MAEKRLGRLGTMTEASVYARVAETNNLDYEGDLPTITHLPSYYAFQVCNYLRMLDASIAQDGGEIPPRLCNNDNGGNMGDNPYTMTNPSAQGVQTCCPCNCNGGSGGGSGGNTPAIPSNIVLGNTIALDNSGVFIFSNGDNVKFDMETDTNQDNG